LETQAKLDEKLPLPTRCKYCKETVSVKLFSNGENSIVEGIEVTIRCPNCCCILGLGLYRVIESQVMATTVLGNQNSETVYIGILSN